MTRAPRRSKAPEAPTELELRGSLDAVDPEGVARGWCWSPQQPAQARELALLVDGTEMARIVADQPREDLQAAGVGTGAHAFLATLPEAGRVPGATAVVGLLDVATGRAVGGERSVTWSLPAPPDLPPLAGNLDTMTRDGWLSGWCWDPEAPTRRLSLDIWVDEALAGTVVAADPRPDLHYAGLGDGAYAFSFAIPYDVLADRGTVRVRVAESGTGRRLGEPALLQIGRRVAAEMRVLELERQVTLMRGRIDELARQAASQPQAEERAARALFTTVAGFFQDLAEGVASDSWGTGLRGGVAPVLERLRTSLPKLALRRPEAPVATVAVAGTASVAILHACLAALHAAGTDRIADIVLLEPGGTDPAGALLPALVPNLRAAIDPGGIVAAWAGLARDADTRLLALVSPDVLPQPGWLEALVETLDDEPRAALAGAAAIRADGLLQHAGLALQADQRFLDLGHLARAMRADLRFRRPVDAVAALALLADRTALRDTPIDAGYAALGPAVADLCLRLRAAGRTVLWQPAARALWTELEDTDPARTTPEVRAPTPDGRRLRQTVATAEARGEFRGHALVVDEELPRPDRDAGSVACLEQMLVLRRLGWRVTFAAASAAVPAEADRLRLERAGVEVAEPSAASITDLLRDLADELGLVHLYRHRIADLLLPRVRELAPRARTVFSPADLHFLREQREALLAGRPSRAEATREQELRCVRDADATILVSDHEGSLLATEVDPAKLHLLRWVARSVADVPGFAARTGLMFVGHFRHGPNVDAVQWYARAVIPVLRRLRPGLVTTLVGADAPAAIRALEAEDLRLLGWAPDLAPLLDGVRATVAPLRYGAGFKGKVATSLARGVPVIGTAVALEGTGLLTGDGVALADEPEAFARAIVQIHDDAAGWPVLSGRARDCVDRLYSPEAAAAVFRGLLADLGLPFDPPWLSP